MALLRLLVFVGLASAAAIVRADAPIVSHRYLADPTAMVHEGRVYLYCSNDDENATAGGYEMKSLVCVSSSDLKNWTDHGVVFTVPDQATWARHSWAPAVIHRNGEFFLYFSNNASGIGVAKSRSPVGPFYDARGRALITSATPGVLPATNMWVFDPSVMIDDDGQAYLSFGGNGESNVRIIKLNADMISTDGPAVALSAPNYFEASYLHKRNGLYYLSYSTNTAGGLRIDYLTSSSPTSGYTYRGIVAGQPPSNNNNNHAAIFELHGSWYHAYHNRVVAMQAGIPPVYRRNIALEKLEYNEDGTIRQIAYTANGVPQVGAVDPYRRVEAETTQAQNGIETEASEEGGMAVRFAAAGSWLRVQGVDFGGGGAKGFTARVLAAAAGGRLELRLGSPTGTLLGTLEVAATSALQQTTVAGADGKQDLYLVYAAGAGLLVDWWRFEAGAPTIVTEPEDRAVVPGGTLRLQARATGVANTYQWSRNGETIAGATQPTLTVSGMTDAQAGSYRVRVVNAEGTVESRSANVTVGSSASRLVNMSCRTEVRAGQTVVPSFFILGTGSKQVLIRAVGPTLGSYGVAGPHSDPSLRVYRGGTVVAENDNWDAQAMGTAGDAVGAFPLETGSKDAALLATLEAGHAYSVHVSGVGTTSGIVLLEVYDADGVAATSRFVNVSVRANAGQEAATLVMGFVLGGEGRRTLLLRGAGPALIPYGVAGALRDPQLVLYPRTGAALAFNAGWAAANAEAALTAAGAAVLAFPFAANSRDSALLMTLDPGLYTVQVTTPTAAGEALAEIYEVD